MSLAAGTVVTRDHLAYARLAGRTWTDNHPRSTFTIVVVDHDGMAPPRWTHRDIRIVGPDALGVDTAELHTLAAIYSPGELACSLKARSLQLGLREADAAVYIDGDVEVLAAMDELEDLARDRGVVLCPHTLHPVPTDGHLPDRLTMLRAGMFNGGLVAVGQRGRPFLDWWADQLRRCALYEAYEGMHADQRWLDCVPAFFDHHVLRDPTFDVAYWNLHERHLEWDGERLRVGGRPVRCFHYSGLVADSPWSISQFTGDVPRVALRDSPAAARVVRRYLDQLRAAGVEEDRALGYRFAASADGTPVDRRARRLWREQLLAHEAGAGGRPPGPFDDDGGRSWVAWLRQPAGDQTVGRYLHRVWEESSDLQRLFADLDRPADRARFTWWAAHHGAEAAAIPPSLLPDTGGFEMDDPAEPERPPRRRARRPDVRSQLPLPDLDAARHALDRPRDGSGLRRLVQRAIGGPGTAQGHDVERPLVGAVEELAGRVTDLGQRLNRADDELGEQAGHIDDLEAGIRRSARTDEELAARVDDLDRSLVAQGRRVDGALEQDAVTAAIVADAEARLSAEVAELHQRLAKLAGAGEAGRQDEADGPSAAGDQPGPGVGPG